MKKGKKIGLIVIAVVVCAVVVCGVLFGCYVPRYLADRTVYDCTDKAETDAITMMSFNIRCYTPTDLFRRSWFYRAPLVVRTIAAASPDVIGFQEVTPIQERYLRRHLLGYTFVMAYRTAHGTQEGMLLAYRTARFTDGEQGMFWISETPSVESKDWGSSIPRVAVYATLTDKRTGKVFTALDTHLDHISAEARGEGMRVLCQQRVLHAWSAVVMMGDMNDYDDSLQYNRAMAAGLADAQVEAAQPYVGTGATFQKYGTRLDERRIDYFYLSAQFTVDDYHVVDDTFDGVYASDHFAIVTVVR